MWIRLTGYFGGREATRRRRRGAVEAIVALDPHYHRAYEYGARRDDDRRHRRRRKRTLPARARRARARHREFPDDWKLPYLAGQIYTQDLETKDPAQRRAWDERGTLLTESAIRKPGAPLEAATWVAFMRTKLGQRDRAIRDLRELLLVTRDDSARARTCIDKLAKLEDTDSAEHRRRRCSSSARCSTRSGSTIGPTIPPTMYILLGPRLAPGFDMTDLATGGRDLVTTAPPEKLEPLD